MKGEFLLEIGTEEIPATFVAQARDSLMDLFTKALDVARIPHGRIDIYATPRRLILSAFDVAPAQAAREIEKIGPSRVSAFDKDGNPTKAGEGFARGQGVNVADLVIVKTAKGEQVAVRRTEQGLLTVQVLSELLPGLIEKISFPKTMRWMDLDIRFARPVHWIVALFESQIVPFVFGNIRSGNASRGHRFASRDSFPVASLEDLRLGLEKDGVIIDQTERTDRIRVLADVLATNNGLKVFHDAELLNEIAFLTESPYPLMGTFPTEFLELPASILITCMKKHQRYFSVHDDSGRIANRFIAVNNTAVKDPAASLAGHERVLKARLEDARFYFREDRKEPLISRLDALKGVVFHSLLGTAYEKVERFTSLALKLAEKLAPDKSEQVERAALLCKCDLETGIVYEFPELQGIIGSYYAKMDGEPEEVSAALREHYLPTYSGDSLPQGMVGALISIADRMDTIAGCFTVGLIPTGTADPYALRRHSLGFIQIVMHLGRPLDLRWLVREAVQLHSSRLTRDAEAVEAEVIDFIRTRFVNFHTGRDFSLDAVEAVVRARFDDVVDARRRLEALQRWKSQADFDAVMIGFKRVVNILRDTRPTELSEHLLEEDEEKKLFLAYRDVEKRVMPLFEKGDYAEALQALAQLKGPIDTFFDKVMVMVEAEKLRNNRLGLLRKIAGMFGRIADFSFIGSTAETK